MLSLNRFRRARRSAEESEPRSLRERGAAALEFALIAPFFFLVVFGGIEIGIMFRNNLALQDSVRSAARVAAVERNNADADLQIIRKINARVGDLNGDVSRIVIFGAETLSAEVPLYCTENGSSQAPEHKCNVYTVTDGDVAALISNIEATSAQTGLQPEFRGSNDNIGIYVEYNYEYVTGFFETLTLSSQSVQVIELDL